MFFLLFLTILNLLLFINLNHLLKLLPVYDFPDNKRKIHSSSIPKIGGIILLFNVIPSFFFLEYIQFEQNIFLLLFILILSFFISLLDDLKDVKPTYRLLSFYIIFFIWIYLDSTMQIKSLNFLMLGIKVDLGIYTYFITPLFILIFLNALNLYDGVNGQTVSYIMLFFLFFFLNDIVSYIYVLLVPFLAFFLYFNLKNKIFLGDTGVTLLAILISFVVINNYNVNKNLYCEEIFLIMMLPGIDMLRVYLVRLVRRKDPFKSDNNHLHHILMKKIPKKFVFIYQAILISTMLILYYTFSVNLYYIFFIVLVFYTFSLLYLNAEKSKT